MLRDEKVSVVAAMAAFIKRGANTVKPSTTKRINAAVVSAAVQRAGCPSA